jgi:hypothetical protein
MNASTTLLAALGAGGLAYAGYRWYRRREEEMLLGALHDETMFRELRRAEDPRPPAKIVDFWTEMRRPATTPAPRATSGGGLTRRFDPLFAAYGGSIPVPYLRALAHAESGLNPSDRKGLINVVGVAIDDYNRRRGTKHRPEDMRIPDVNVRIAADTLQTIVASYRKNHPEIPNLRENWRNQNFVELLTLGWNAGFSEASGVGKVARYLKARGQTAVTADLIHKKAAEAGATRWLSEPPIAAAKLAWSKGVARRYFAERERDADAARRLVAMDGRHTLKADG